MTTATDRVHKRYLLDTAKLKRAQRALKAKTESETIERALDPAIEEYERTRLSNEADERFPTGARINVSGKLGR